MSARKWKRVGDYPPPEGQQILLRYEHENKPWMTPGRTHNLLKKCLLWCEVEIPTEVEDPPIDPKVEELAEKLRNTFWESDSPHHTRPAWELSAAKDAWRAVAKAAIEALDPAPKWRSINDMERAPRRPVLVRDRLGEVCVRESSSLNYSAWREYREMPDE